jgi:adenylosuccinate lyase
MNPHDSYRSALEGRYASPAMRALWSDQRRFSTWRRIWLALAQAQQSLGLPITARQIDQLRSCLDDIDFENAARHEERLRHDVMAHVHSLGDAAPAARPIIHLGATSQDIVCNADLLLMREALGQIAAGLARVIDALATFAARYRTLPTLGFTHFQPAQPTTVGRRAALWACDFALALEEIEHRLATLRFRGMRGATGTQASFLWLFDGDAKKVEQMNALVAKELGWSDDPACLFAVTGQTYPRIVDAQILNTLAVAAAAAHKCATDLRLLAHRKEIEEPFEAEQVGSSAMAYKRNPMRCERACALARFVMNLPGNALATAATQWLERTLDDSANRRLVIPESFLALDAVLLIMHNVASGLVVYEHAIRANLAAELPFMASETIMLAAAARGADRQEAHEVVRRHSQAAAHAVKSEGKPNDLLDRLRKEPMFAKVDFDAALDPAKFIGLAPQQVDQFIAEVVEPIRSRHAAALGKTSTLRV